MGVGQLYAEMTSDRAQSEKKEVIISYCSSLILSVRLLRATGGILCTVPEICSRRLMQHSEIGRNGDSKIVSQFPSSSLIIFSLIILVFQCDKHHQCAAQKSTCIFSIHFIFVILIYFQRMEAASV